MPLIKIKPYWIMIPVNRPLIAPEDLLAVEASLKDTFISGEIPVVKQMESMLAEVVQAKSAIAVSTGTAALDLIYEAINISSDSEIISPTFTIISSISNALRKGAKVTLVDSDPITWCMDSDIAANLVSKKTTAIVPVHIYGMSVDLNPILECTANTETLIIEDAAEALGAKYRNQPCGGIGDLGIVSFYANKIVTGGEGGAILSNREGLTQKFRQLRNLAFSQERFVHNELGWNSRISGLSASLINSQLQRMPELLKRKKEIGSRYLTGLEGHPWFQFPILGNEYTENTFWVFGLLIKDEIRINAKYLSSLLLECGIETRRFFCPMHLQPLPSQIKSNFVIPKPMPVSEMLWENGLYLPSGLGNTNNEIDYVIDQLWKLAKENKNV